MKYRKRPVVIDAFKWTGDLDQKEDPEWAIDAIKNGIITFPGLGTSNCVMRIHTLEGDMTAQRGDFVIRGVNGELYPCKPDIFEKTYESAECEGEAPAPKNFGFGEAIRHMKAGRKLARAGWNGKGMFVVYQKGYPQGIPCNTQTAEAWGMNEGDLFVCNPYLQIKNVDGSHSMWVPSINDVLAEDWMIV